MIVEIIVKKLDEIYEHLWYFDKMESIDFMIVN
jgi:hypothetical protein